MKQLNIPFKLGMQYDNWEFDLEVTKDRIEGCDSYIYIGKEFNKFLNYSTDKTELLFSLDVLELVLITLNTNSFLNSLLNKNVNYNILKIKHTSILTIKIGQSINWIFEYRNKTKIIIGRDSKIIYQIYLSLLC